MITAVDILLGVLAPTVFGGLAALLLLYVWPRFSGAAASWGMLVATVVGFANRFGQDNFAFAQGATPSAFWSAIAKATWSDIATPKSAVAWIPILAVIAFGVATSIGALPLPGVACAPKRVTRAPRLVGVGIWVTGLIFALMCAMVTRVLWTSVYFTDQYSMSQKLATVAVPGLGMAAIWTAAWLGDHKRLRRGNGPVTPAAFTGACGLFVLALTAIVVVSTSGSLTVAFLIMPALSFGLIFYLTSYAITRAATAGLQHPSRQSIAILVIVSTSLPVMIGHFMAEVAWWTAALHGLSAWLLFALWPTRDQSKTRKWTMIIVSCLPAIIAAAWSAYQMSLAISNNPYGGY